MIKLKEQYPFIEDDGTENEGLILHWGENTNGERYYIKQNETGLLYISAVDLYPCPYTYSVTDKKIKNEDNEEDREKPNEE